VVFAVEHVVDEGDVEVIAVDVEVDLAADEGEARAEFAEGFRDPACQGVL
jgi:hypothetical protein